MNKISKASFFEVIAFLVIFAFPVIHETGYNVWIIRSPGIFITPGILFILSGLFHSERVCRFRDRCLILGLFMAVWTGGAFLLLLIPGFNQEIAFSTLFIIPAILIFISNSCRLIRAQTLRNLNLLVSFLFVIILINSIGLKALQNINGPELVRIFVDQYFTSLFFLILYLFIPSLLIITGRGYLNSSDTLPLKEYLRFFIPFQILFYMFHTVLIVMKTALSHSSLILHLQIILILFLFIQFLNGIFNTGKSYKNPVEVKIQKISFGFFDRFVPVQIGAGAILLGAGFLLLTPVLYKSAFLTLVAVLVVYCYCKKIRYKDTSS